MVQKLEEPPCSPLLLVQTDEDVAAGAAAMEEKTATPKKGRFFGMKGLAKMGKGKKGGKKDAKADRKANDEDAADGDAHAEESRSPVEAVRGERDNEDRDDGVRDRGDVGESASKEAAPSAAAGHDDEPGGDACGRAANNHQTEVEDEAFGREHIVTIEERRPAKSPSKSKSKSKTKTKTKTKKPKKSKAKSARGGENDVAVAPRPQSSALHREGPRMHEAWEEDTLTLDALTYLAPVQVQKSLIDYIIDSIDSRVFGYTPRSDGLYVFDGDDYSVVTDARTAITEMEPAQTFMTRLDRSLRRNFPEFFMVDTRAKIAEEAHGNGGRKGSGPPETAAIAGPRGTAKAVQAGISNPPARLNGEDDRNDLGCIREEGEEEAQAAAPLQPSAGDVKLRETTLVTWQSRSKSAFGSGQPFDENVETTDLTVSAGFFASAKVSMKE